MIYLAIPSITPRLARCAIDAIRRTTPERHRVILDMGPGTHGEKLDRMFAGLPSDAEYFFTCDDDAAPLKRGWLSWLIHQSCGKIAITFGESKVVGALYPVQPLREVGRAYQPGLTFQPRHPRQNPGDEIPFVRSRITRCYRRDPWWLRNCELYTDEHGDLLFAHLGGGTIGHTWRHQGKLYPRIPTWLWPIMVRRHLRRQRL